MKKLLIVMGVALCASLYASRSDVDVTNVDDTRAAATDTIAPDSVSIPIDSTENVNNSEK